MAPQTILSKTSKLYSQPKTTMLQTMSSELMFNLLLFHLEYSGIFLPYWEPTEVLPTLQIFAGIA